MKLKRIITGSLLALTMAFGVGVGVSANRKAEVKEVEAKTLASTKLYIQLSDARWKANRICLWLWDGTHEAWGPYFNPDNSSTYYEYDISGLGFTPTNAIATNFWYDATPASWCLDWDNGGVYSRTTDITLNSDDDVIWLGSNINDSKSCNFGTYSLDTYIKGGNSESWSQATVNTKLSSFKINSAGHLEVYGSVSLPANTYFKANTLSGNNWYGSYTAHSSIQSNLSGGGDNNIHNTAAANYEFYFDYDSKTTYITDPVEAAADEWAQAFLANVGCDGTGKTVPSGWSGEVTRYNAITDGDVKDRIYGATAKEDGTYVQQAVARYDVAVRNHPNLTKFIKDSHNNTRSGAVIVNPISKTISDKNTATSIIVVAVVSLTAIAATGFFFFFYKKKNQ